MVKGSVPKVLIENKNISDAERGFWEIYLLSRFQLAEAFMTTTVTEGEKLM